MTQERVLGQRPNSLMVNFMGSSRRTGEQGGGADCSRGREFKPSPAPGQTALRSMALSQNSRANKQKMSLKLSKQKQRNIFTF